MQARLKSFKAMGVGGKIQLAIAVNVVLAIILGQYLVHDWWNFQGGTGLVVNIAMNLGICLLYGYVVARAIVRPLRSATRVMQDIAAGDGDLSQRLVVESRDEAGEIAGNVNLFLDKLQGIIANVARASGQLASAVTQLTASTSHSLKASQSQGTEVAAAAHAIEQMTASIHEVDQHALEANTSAQEANGQAQDSALKAVEAMCGIDNLVKEIEQAADAIDKLQEHSEGIGSVIEVITNIAEQTNLLALNAAIEAARAGEQGRGFAVVADEVRTLANRTQASTREIQDMIENLQGETNAAVNVMQAARTHAQQEATQVETTAEALAEIAHSVSMISEVNQRISASTTEQSGVMEAVHHRLDTMTRISAETTADTQNINQISEDLLGLTHQLEALVGQFKLGA